MRGSLVVASNSGSASHSTSKPVQIIKIVKPAAGHTETFHASFDGTVKIDFTAIANEKITLCHDNKNQSLHIIFADDSQVVIEPFFDSMAVMSNLVFEMTPGQVLNSAEFASQFPITTDQSVLPAGAEGVQSGAEFNDPSVDPLPPNVPLALLPPEELPPIVFHETIPVLPPFQEQAVALPPVLELPPNPSLNIVKFVNGEDADTPTGPHVAAGSTVTFTYVVTDTGNVPLANVVVADDKLGPITSFTGDTNGNGLLDLTETWTYTQTATALAGQQTNVGTVTGQDASTGTTASDDNPANYFGDAPAINIVKFVNGQDADTPTGPHVAAGSTATFTYVVTDTGNVPLANVVVTDDKLGPITSFTGDTNGNGLLDLTETWTYTQTATALAGQQTNVGTVTGQDANNPPGATVTDDNPANYFGDAPAINIVKFVNGQDADTPTGPHVPVGSTATFTYVVTDTGNVPLANVVVTDDKLGPITSFTGDTNGNGLLDLTETWTYTQTATALAGQQTNVGTVTGQDASTGTTASDDNPANYFGDAPAINIVKFVNGQDADTPTGPHVAAGSTVTFTYVVTDTGNVPLANVVVTDDKLGPITSFTGDTNGNGLLDLTETWTYTQTATALAGQQTNVGTVTGQDANNPPGATVTDDNPANYFGDAPGINIVKFVNGQDADSPTGPNVPVGSTVTFTYVVTDTGNVPLANVVVTDDKLGPITSFTGDTNGNNLLDLTETWTYTQTATALAGQQTNVGTVTGQDANNPPGTTVTDDNPANYFGDAPAINIVKFVNGQDADSPTGPNVAAGSTATFTYVVTDTGNVPLANVVVTDDKLGPITSFTGDTNGNNLLDLTETWTYTQTATALAGQQTNVGTVTGQDANNPPGATVTDDNPANYFGDAPAINIVKFVNGQDADTPTGPHVAAGSTATFTYVVTDTGNVPLANVVVTDDKLGPITSFTGDTNGNGLLDLTETWTYTQTATALAGQQTNVGTVTGQDANNPPGTTVTDDNPANYFGDAPAINIVKFVNGQDADTPTGPHVAAGSTATFTYVVTDTGNVPLANVVVTDDKLGPITSFTGDTNGNGLLDLTETWTYTQTATALAGQQTNVGTVTGQDANNPPGTTVTDDNPANYFGDAPAINIVKFVNGQDADTPTGPHVAAGSTATFTYVVTDTGNVPLANVVVTDDKLGPITSFTGDTNGNGLLDLTETWTYTQTATALAGQQTNVGTVTGQDANNPPGTTVTDDNPANYFGDAPAINIVKFVNGQDADTPTGPHVAAGSTATFTYVVTDTGNVPLANVVVTDDKLGPITSFTGDTNGNGLLDLTETWTYTQTATALAGQQTNVGTVTGQDASTGTTASDDNPANYFGDAPAINIVKFVNGQDADTPTGPHVAAGSTATFTYVVTDTGNVPLANVVVTDDKLGPITSFTGDTNGNGLLDLTETWTYTQTATALAGQQTNVGTVTGQDANNPPGTTVTDDNPANYFGDAPAINIVKFVNGQDADSPTGPHVPVGSTVTYTYVVTDTGNVPLANVVVTDDKLGPITSFTGDTNGNGLLDLTETWTYTQTATALAGQQTNVGTVTGQDANNPPGATVTDDNPANYFGDAPGINIVKFVNGQDADSPTGPNVPVGSTVTYTYVVTDTGNVPLANVVVTDDKLGPITSFTGDTNGNNLLDLTETWTYTQTATALAGQQTNVGTVTGQDANIGTTASDDNPANYFGTNTTPTGGGSVSLLVNEAALDLVLDAGPPADLHAGAVTGSNPSSRAETAQATTGITFNATGEAITVAFGDPAVAGSGWVAPTVGGLASGYTLSWSVVSGELVADLIQTAGNVDLGAALYLHLTGTSASPGNSVTPTVTATLTDQLQHALTPAGTNDVTITGLHVVATDTSGDQVFGTVGVTVRDDIPTAFTPETIYVEDTSHTVLSGQINFISHAGADGLGDVVFNVAEGDAVHDSTGANVALNGEQLFYHIVNSHTVEARSSAADGSDLGFTEVLHPGTIPGTDTWDFTLNGTLFNGSGFTTLGATPSGGNAQVVGFNTLSSPDTPNDLLVTANGTNNVNTSQGNFGVGNGQSLALSDVLRFDFVTNETTNGTLAGTAYGTHYEVSHFTETLTKVPGNGTVSFTIKALNADDDLNFVGDTSGETIVSGLLVTITNASGGAAPTAVENPVTHIWTITGADLNDTFTVNATTDPFSAIEITGISGVFATGPATFFTANAVNPFSILTPITGTDGDGDPIGGVVAASLSPDASTTRGTSGDDTLTTTATITTLLGEDGNDTLNGLNGQVDTLAGGRGNDTLIGHGGADILSGGSGADHFQYTLPTDGGDHILDFSSAEGDSIDILLTGFTGAGLAAGNPTAAQFGSSADNTFATGAERFHFNTASHTLLYDADGSAGGSVAVILAVLDNAATLAANNIHIG